MAKKVLTNDIAPGGTKKYPRYFLIEHTNHRIYPANLMSGKTIAEAKQAILKVIDSITAPGAYFDDAGGYFVGVRVRRPETDTEYNKRVAKLERQAAIVEIERKKKEAAEYEQYVALRKKFEGE